MLSCVCMHVSVPMFVLLERVRMTLISFYLLSLVCLSHKCFLVLSVILSISRLLSLSLSLSLRESEVKEELVCSFFTWPVGSMSPLLVSAGSVRPGQDNQSPHPLKTGTGNGCHGDIGSEFQRFFTGFRVDLLASSVCEQVRLVFDWSLEPTL